MITGHTRLAGVIATPIKHSLSPLIHNSGYEIADIDACYLAFEVEEKKLGSAFESIHALNMLGVNISMPYKRRAYERADKHTEVAQLLGVCNTLVNQNGELLGANTDGAGFINSLKAAGVLVKNKKVVILGAGGAAKAVACECGLEGAKEIHIFKRKNKTFAETVDYFEELNKKIKVPYYVHAYEATPKLTQHLLESNLLINATNIGMGSQELPIPSLEGLHPKLYVADLIYYPLNTRLMKEAKNKGCATQNGLGMLVHQAAISFEMMTSKKMNISEVMQKVLLELEKETKNQ